MITVIDGLQGAGKSYYAVHYMMEHKKQYNIIYTNIDGFKFHDNIKPLLMSDFLSNLEECHFIYHNEEKTDQDILDYLYSIGFLNSSIKTEINPVLIVVDEAHNFLDIKNGLWTWFITYHRHLFVDAIFITQDTKLIHYHYHKLFQNILHAMPSSKQILQAIPFADKLLPNFLNKNKYQKHIKLPISDGKYGTFAGNIFLPKIDDYYNLYNAGDVVRSESLLQRYVVLFLFLILALFIIVPMFIRSFTDTSSIETVSEPTPIKKKYQTSKRKYSTIQSRDLPSNATYLGLTCISSICTNKTHHININISHLKDLLKDTDSRYLSSVQHNSKMATLYILASSSFIGLFKGAKNEKNKGSGFNFMR